jgi:hypothetical protein
MPTSNRAANFSSYSVLLGGALVRSPHLDLSRTLTRQLTHLTLASIVLGGALAAAQDVLTYHNNNARTGSDAKEIILAPSNVNVNTFGRLFTITVDGKVDAQPLYLSAVNISGTAHNILIVASEHGSVYGFDADSGSSLWQITTLQSGETTSDDRGCNQIEPEIGITATPVIYRPSGSNGIIFVVAMSKDSGGNYHQRLHALDAASGSELHSGPVEISAQYPGTGDNSSGGYVIFDPAQYKERSGLILLGGTVYLAWASHCDIRPYTGWIMGYNSSTLAQKTVLNVTPNGNEGAFWGSGAGLASDGVNLFVLDANGYFDTTLTSGGFPSSGDYGNSALKITTNGGLKIADYWEMYNQQSENDGDVDLGSGGALVLPSVKDSSNNSWQLLASAGKDGNLYLVDRANMGKFSSTANNIYQEIDNVLPGGMWAMPAYLNGKLYYGPVGQPLLAFQFKNAKLQSTPVAKTATSFAFPGTTPSISSNSAKNAIVWAAENSDPAVLHAYNPTNLQELYNSNQAANNRDQFGTGNKYITPTIANGKVYVGTTTGVGAFGLLSSKVESKIGGKK